MATAIVVKDVVTVAAAAEVAITVTMVVAVKVTITIAMAATAEVTIAIVVVAITVTGAVIAIMDARIGHRPTFLDHTLIYLGHKFIDLFVQLVGPNQPNL